MAKFTIERDHAHTTEETRTRIQALGERLGAEYGLSLDWKSDTEANVKGKGSTGKITCSPNKVSIMIDLSFALSMFKGKIQEKVETELERALA